MTITKSDIYTAFSETYVRDSWVSVAQINTNLYLLAWIGSDYDLYAIAAYDVDGEIFFGTRKTIDTGTFGCVACCKFSSTDMGFICYVPSTGETDDDKITGEWVQIESDYTITLKTEVKIGISGNIDDEVQDVACCNLDEERVAVFGFVEEDSSGDNELWTVTADRNGNGLTYGNTDKQEADDISYNPRYSDCFKIDRDIACILYMKNSRTYGRIIIYSAGNVQDEDGFIGLDSGNYPSGCRLDYNKIITAGTKTSDNSHGHAKVGTITWTEGANEISDGDMEPGASWTGVNGTAASVSGGQSGNCLKITETGGGDAYAYHDVVVSGTGRFKIVFYVKAGNEATYNIEAYDVNTAATIYASKDCEATSEWVRQTFFFTAIDAVNSTRIILRQKCGSGSGTYIYFDELEITKYTSFNIAFGSSTAFESTGSCYVHSICAIDATHALCVYYTGGDYYAASLVISGDAVSADDTLVPVSLSGYPTLVPTGAANTFFLCNYNMTTDTGDCLLLKYRELATVKARLSVGGMSDTLRLIEVGDADYPTLRMCVDSVHVVNGDFENWTTGMPDNWNLTSNAIVSEETVDPYSGSISLKLQSSGEAWQEVYSDPIKVTPDTYYSIQLYYKTNAGNTTRLRFWDLSNAAYISYNVLVASTSWKKISIGLTTPSGCVSLHIVLGIVDGGDTGWFDDIKPIPVLLAADLVEDDPVFNNFPVRVYDGTNIRQWRDSSVE